MEIIKIRFVILELRISIKIFKYENHSNICQYLNDYTGHSQEPIDFAHWFLFVGVVLLIPQVASFPKKIFTYIGMPLVLIGIACIIGMCVLDFIWWSYPTKEARIAFTEHVSNVQSIWEPFISVGSSSNIFNTGLFLLSLNYFKSQKLAIAILFIATLMLLQIIPIPYRHVVAYSLTLVAFGIIFFGENKSTTNNVND